MSHLTCDLVERSGFLFAYFLAAVAALDTREIDVFNYFTSTYLATKDTFLDIQLRHRYTQDCPFCVFPCCRCPQSA
jgi:hypothetical protein